MKRGLSVALLAAAPFALSQQPPSTPKPAPAAITDALAHTFSGTRSAAHLRHLTRIPDRPALRQIVCTAAVASTAPSGLIMQESQADGALFFITDPAHLPAEFQRVAEYDDHSARGRHIARFSIAAFQSPTDPAITWVGVALYWGRLTEYIATHLTKSYFPPDLGPSIATPCRAVR